MIGEVDNVKEMNTQVLCYYQLRPNLYILYILTQELTTFFTFCKNR